VVMDNLSAHKGERVRELIEKRGCELLYLPPYSPDLNPIEEASAKVKALLRKVAARSRGALVEAMGAALDAITAQDAHGFFRALWLPRTGPALMPDALGALEVLGPKPHCYQPLRQERALHRESHRFPAGDASRDAAIMAATQSGKPQDTQDRKGGLSCPNWK
jgi:hypothetical protein